MLEQKEIEKKKNNILLIEKEGNMRKKLFSYILILVLIMSTSINLSTTAYGAQSGSVNITLPNFKVTMNGQVVNNKYSKYPLIVYKDITYFPMTYSDCRYLGIESTWKGDKEGLMVDTTGVTAAYNPYTSSSRNGRSYIAQIPSFPIKVNGKAIENSKEEYPLLSFRNITYFPMTWKYGVDEFGWDYKFDGKNGLVIRSKNIQLQQIKLPNDRGKENEYSDFAGKKSICVLVKKGYVYYDNNNGAIVQASLSDTSKTKKIYQLEKDIYSGENYRFHKLYEENGKPMLYFHSGGATMGSDYRIELNNDGTTNQIQDSYYQTTAIGDKLFRYFAGPMPGPGNLSMQKKGSSESEVVRLGSPDYWYYGLTLLGGIRELFLIGNQLYVRAAKVTSRSEEGKIKLANTAVYKVNTDTNEVIKVSKTQGDVSMAQIEGDYLYYLSRSKSGDDVYKVSLKDGVESHVGKLEGIPEYVEDNSFAIMGGKPYFAKEDMQLYTLEKNESLNPKAELTGMNVTGSKGEYLVCTFKETANAKYRIMVFNQSGEVVFKTSDCGSNVVIERDNVFFYNITTEKVCSGKLK